MSERSWEGLRDLKQLGLRIAIDDFGTGYSSLAYLSERAIDVLKIDRSFTAGLSTSTRSHAVPRTVIQLARSLGLAVVAEGIETEQHVEILQGLGCPHGQGCLFARPAPVASFPLPAVDAVR